jgi:hypothetical protein
MQKALSLGLGLFLTLVSSAALQAAPLCEVNLIARETNLAKTLKKLGTSPMQDLNMLAEIPADIIAAARRYMLSANEELNRTPNFLTRWITGRSRRAGSMRYATLETYYEVLGELFGEYHVLFSELKKNAPASLATTSPLYERLRDLLPLVLQDLTRSLLLAPVNTKSHMNISDVIERLRGEKERIAKKYHTDKVEVSTNIARDWRPPAPVDFRRERHATASGVSSNSSTSNHQNTTYDGGSSDWWFWWYLYYGQHSPALDTHRAEARNESSTAPLFDYSPGSGLQNTESMNHFLEGSRLESGDSSASNHSGPTLWDSLTQSNNSTEAASNHGNSETTGGGGFLSGLFGGGGGNNEGGGGGGGFFGGDTSGPSDGGGSCGGCE